MALVNKKENDILFHEEFCSTFFFSKLITLTLELKNNFEEQLTKLMLIWNWKPRKCCLGFIQK